MASSPLASQVLIIDDSLFSQKLIALFISFSLLISNSLLVAVLSAVGGIKQATPAMTQGVCSNTYQYYKAPYSLRRFTFVFYCENFLVNIF